MISSARGGSAFGGESKNRSDATSLRTQIYYSPMQNKTITEQRAEQKITRREKKKQKKMPVSGASVKSLAQLRIKK